LNYWLVVGSPEIGKPPSKKEIFGDSKRLNVIGGRALMKTMHYSSTLLDLSVELLGVAFCAPSSSKTALCGRKSYVNAESFGLYALNLI